MTKNYSGRTVHSHKPRHEHAPMTGYYRVPKLAPARLEALLSSDDLQAQGKPQPAAPAPGHQAQSLSAAALEARAHIERGWQLLQAQASH